MLIEVRFFEVGKQGTDVVLCEGDDVSLFRFGTINEADDVFDD